LCETPQSADLLVWYDRHARAMPWRVPPAARQAGTAPNPYHVWLSEVMLQQTTVAAVKSYFIAFTERWPTVQDLAAAEDANVMAAWAGLGYYARARNLLKCARVVASDYGGRFPARAAELVKLPGIGPYTSAAIASIAFDEPATVLDGNVERVMARLHDDPTPLPGAKPVFMAYAEGLTPQERPGDYAQAVMDLGATICTPRNPACGICPWRDACSGRVEGIHESLPRKTPKAKKPIRHGIAWVAMDANRAILTERRPDKGLLGGMLAVPTTDWAEEPKAEAPPFAAEWTDIGEVRHTFTHFHLILRVHVASKAGSASGYIPLAEAARQMPTVFSKVCKLVAGYE